MLASYGNKSHEVGLANFRKLVSKSVMMRLLSWQSTTKKHSQSAIDDNILAVAILATPIALNL